MLMTFDEFVDRIRKRLEKKGHSKEKLSFHIERLIQRYENSPIFDELEIYDDDDNFEEFEDGIKHLPFAEEDHDVSLPFLILKQTHDEVIEKRIHQLREHYEGVQENRGEEWFPEDEVIDPLNAPGLFGRTPVIEATFQGDIDRVSELIELGADLGARDSSGNDALQVAILNGYDKIAAMIKKELKKNLCVFDLAKNFPDS
jgi:hypothetical protein